MTPILIPPQDRDEIIMRNEVAKAVHMYLWARREGREKRPKLFKAKRFRWLAILLSLSGRSDLCWVANVNKTCPSIADFVIARSS